MLCIDTDISTFNSLSFHRNNSVTNVATVQLNVLSFLIFPFSNRSSNWPMNTVRGRSSSLSSCIDD